MILSKINNIIKKVKRDYIQALATLMTNPHINNFPKGTIHTGKSKYVCSPGLNCYSCPGAAGSCPVGSLQAVIGDSKHSFAYYVLGLMLLFGVLLGRFVCGFLCPFGWFQDLLNKIPLKTIKIKKLNFLRYIKYGILLFIIIIVPLFLTNNLGMAPPYFCKYICPQGILEGGIPLSLASSSIKAALGNLFRFKLIVLICMSLVAIKIYRPFCQWICPLGAFYALLNKVSFLGYHVDKETCISCGKCERVCKFGIDITKDEASPECIRCGDCVKACPVSAISLSNQWNSKNNNDNSSK